MLNSIKAAIGRDDRFSFAVAQLRALEPADWDALRKMAMFQRLNKAASAFQIMAKRPKAFAAIQAASEMAGAKMPPSAKAEDVALLIRALSILDDGS